MFEVVVVGGGPAGVAAALRARELGATVALVERGSLGGTSLNDGCVPTRVLARAARLMRDADQYADYGLVGARPTIDFAELLARTDDTVRRIHERTRLRTQLEQGGIAVFARVGDARFADEQTLMLGNGSVLRGETFILCAGGQARRLPFPGAEHALTHRDIWSLRALPRSVVVIGGAATGCQLASIFAAFQAQVHVLVTGDRLLRGEDACVSQSIEAAFTRRGIEVVKGIGAIERIELDHATSSARRLIFAHGGEPRTVVADAVVLAVGWPGNVNGLNLAAAGVRCEGGYIAVDDALRTSNPRIFAAGDITGRMMLVQSASAEGTLAAENAVLGGRRDGAHGIVPHGGFTDPEYGSVGLTEAQAQAQTQHAAAAATVAYADLDRAVIDGHVEGFCKLITDRRSRRVLGAHIVGEQAVEIAQVLAASMTAGLRIEQLAEIELAYPTYTSIVGLAARQLTRELNAVAGQPLSWLLRQPRLGAWARGEVGA